MNKNPFSFYDFLGYLFPGLIAMMVIAYIVFLGLSASIEDYFNIKNFISMFKDKVDVNWWESTVVVIVLAYIFGHIVAYLSSTIVEYFANRSFGYPSYYLLHEGESSGMRMWRRYLRIWGRYFKEDKNFGNILWRILVLIILFPVSFGILLLGIPLSIEKFIVRPLDEYVRNSIQNKLCSLSVKLGISRPDVNSRADYHRIVMHYVYLNIPNCQRKTDNYVAIYGFLRAITLISCMFFDYLLGRQLMTVVEFCSNERVGGEVNVNAILILLGMLVLCNVLFMGFVKFYRRFTLENYMALLTEKE